MRQALQKTTDAILAVHRSLSELKARCADDQVTREEIGELELILDWARTRLEILEARSEVQGELVSV